jgi:RNA polymerase sigma-70 factor, ECF subfamily
MTESDEQLLEKLRAHDREALGRWLTVRQPTLRSYIEHRLGAALRRKIEPDDLIQEVHTDAVRSFPEVDLTERDPFGWLCQIAERRIIDAHRRFFGSQKRDAGREVRLEAAPDTQRPGIVDLLIASMTTASQAFSRNQREIRLLSALESLPEDQRTALKMRYIEGLPSKDIAEKLGKTDGAIRVMLTRCLSRLQELLGEE